MMEYDYVIIGAGSAGCVLANRLTEDPTVQVALLEAGGKGNHWTIQLPMGVQKLAGHTPFSWNYTTSPQAHLDDRAIATPRGRVLGGSSSINAMVYIRGNRLDYDDWAARGAVGWSYADVLPYFRKSENQQRGPSQYHGMGGPLGVSDRPNRYPICSSFIESALGAGHLWTDDFNGPHQEGVGFYQYTVQNGMRMSASRAFLRPALQRPNLHVFTGIAVDRLMIRGDRAVGVVGHNEGGETIFNASREVILSAGAINTPQLLMLSGIGPAGPLERLGIRVRCASEEVGKNLQDHLVIRTQYELNARLSMNSTYHHWFEKLRAVGDYAVRRGGPIAYPISPVGIFLKSSLAAERPDLQLYFGNYSFDPATAVPHRFPGISLASSHLHPTSRGHVALVSNQSSDPPKIDPNYLATERDRAVMCEGVRAMAHIMGRPEMSRYVKRQIDGLDGDSGKSLGDYVRRKAVSIYHPVGTCRMGSDTNAVVDASLRVQGVRSLRVVDASVMPSLISGNTNATAIMIGEKGADLIRNR